MRNAPSLIPKAIFNYALKWLTNLSKCLALITGTEHRSVILFVPMASDRTHCRINSFGENVLHSLYTRCKKAKTTFLENENK
jgi:hypothetical protein